MQRLKFSENCPQSLGINFTKQGPTEFKITIFKKS